MTIFVIQKQNDFKIIVENSIKQLSKELLNCKINCHIKDINFFLPTIELEHVFVEDQLNKSWSWDCKSLKFNCSWYDYFLTGKFIAYIEINHLNAYSEMENSNLAIYPHLKQLVLSNKSNLPVSIKDIKLNKSNIKICNKEINLETNLNFDGELKDINNSSKIIVYLTNGEILKEKKIISNELSGLIQINIPKLQNVQPDIDINGLCNLPNLKSLDNRCYFIGKWNEVEKFLKISTLDDKIDFNIKNIYTKNNKLYLDLDLKTSIGHLRKITNLGPEFDFEGECMLSMHSDSDLENLQGNCQLQNINTKYVHINNAIIYFDKKNNNWIINFQIINSNNFNNYDISGKCDVSYESNKNLTAKYEFKIKNCEQLIIESQGTSLLNHEKLDITGTINTKKFNITLCLYPYLNLKNFSYFNSLGKECVWANNRNNNIKIKIYFEHIKEWLPDNINHNAMGQGDIIINGQIQNNKFVGNLSSENINITLPQFYNVIKNIDGSLEFDLNQKTLFLNNLKIKLYKGEISCNNAKSIFEMNNNNLVTKYIYCPITIDDCFIRYKKDILGSILGKIILTKNENMPKISGFLFINNAQIKNNIFSQDFRNNLFGNTYSFNKAKNSLIDDFNMDISILSKNSIKIKTPLLNTKINLDLKAIKTLSSFEIIGSINLNDGSIKFPYKDLNIIYGNINFLPNQLMDPIISLTARNRIKGFNVSLHISGSANNPNIKFESSPPLTDEQIIALLLVGSQKGSINMIMTKLIFENIKNMISGSSQTQSKIKKYFKSLLKPLKYIKFVPVFNNEVGRSGIKGSIDIDLSEKLHASMQKNFALQEDTRFEVDYTLTDEINIKGIKDERGDLGGEIELRWKF